MEKKAVNPVPFMIAAIVLLIVGLIYTGMTRPEPESALASSPTPTPTVTALVPKKREKTKLSSEEVKAVLEEAAELVTSKYYIRMRRILKACCRGSEPGLITRLPAAPVM